MERRRHIALVVVLCGCGAGQGAGERPPAYSRPAANIRESVRAYGDGVEALRKRSDERAAELFATATRLDARNHAAWFQIGVGRARASRWQEAVQALERAVALVGDEPVYAFHHGRALLETGRVDDASRALGRAVALDGAQYQARYFHGLALERQGHFEGAAREWTEAARLEPCFTPAFVSLGELYERWQFFDQAGVVAQKGLECGVDPNQQKWRLWALCARTSERRRDVDAALGCYQKAIEARPLPELLFRRALLLEKMGYPDDARADLRRYLQSKDISSWNRRVAEERLKAIDASDQR